MTAPDTTGGELREALVNLLDQWGNLPALLAESILALPALRDLLAERDKLAAQVRAVEGLAEELVAEAEFTPVAIRASGDEFGEFESGHCAGKVGAADRIRRALGTPTTGGGE